MLKSIAFIVIILFLWSCSLDRKDTTDHSSKSSAESHAFSYDGTWAENEQNNALFIISNDTIINVEHNDKMLFKIVHDTMIIDYKEFAGRYIILKHTADSLVLRNEDNSITRLYKR